jgi:hypothetical protein
MMSQTLFLLSLTAKTSNYLKIHFGRPNFKFIVNQMLPKKVFCCCGNLLKKSLQKICLKKNILFYAEDFESGNFFINNLLNIYNKNKNFKKLLTNSNNLINNNNNLKINKYFDLNFTMHGSDNNSDNFNFFYKNSNNSNNFVNNNDSNHNNSSNSNNSDNIYSNDDNEYFKSSNNNTNNYSFLTKFFLKK